MAHPRFCPAHWPEPLTASGAAQACPTCLSSPPNQLTFQGDSHPSRPIERAVRSASVPSQIGGGIMLRPAHFQAFARNHSSFALVCGVCSDGKAPRFLGLSFLAATANQRTFPDPTGSCRPFLVSSLDRSARLQTPRISGLTLRPAQNSASVQTFAFGLLAWDRCSGRWALRVLGPSAIAAVPNQLIFPEQSGSIRPFFPSSLSPKPRFQTKRNGGGNCFDLSCGVLENKLQDSLKDLPDRPGFLTFAVIFPDQMPVRIALFPGKSAGGSLALNFPPFLRVSGTLRRESPFSKTPTTNSDRTYGT